MQDRQHHQRQVQTFLEKNFSCQHWTFALPKGSGNETYLAHGDEHTYFVKLGVQIARYEAMSSVGLVVLPARFAAKIFGNCWLRQ